MNYKNVIGKGLIQPIKARYTIIDLKELLREGYTIAQARDILKSSAIYHGTEYSRTLNAAEMLLKR